MVRSSWTGTRGIVDLALPDDWDEAFMEVKEKSLDSHEEFSSRFVATVWDWAKEPDNLGSDAKKMNIVELAEYWYEFG